jgi:alkylation response protein AidB-like acyl-CoA dehydrogenase
MQMDFSYSQEEEAFRDKIKQWLAVNMKELPDWWLQEDLAGPERGSEEFVDFSKWWHRKLYDAGFVGITWPKEYGGQGGTVMEQVIFYEEIAKHRAPGPTNIHGIGWCGPAIMAVGTEEQKKRYPPKILSAEEIWCTFYSEPEAGSDMANVQTTAVVDGDHWVVNGQKVWNSGAHEADWGVLLVKTDQEARKHRALTYMFVDLKTPGIDVRPLPTISGSAEFNETFFDNVRIPLDQVIGEVNMGWYVAASALEFERSGSGNAIAREKMVMDVIQLAKDMGRNNDPVIRQRLAQLYVETSLLKYMAFRGITYELREGRPGSQGAIASLFGTEFGQRLQEMAVDLQGPYGRLMRNSKHAISHGDWQTAFLTSRGSSIATGTVEIKRNIIAQRVLGLPRQ